MSAITDYPPHPIGMLLVTENIPLFVQVHSESQVESADDIVLAKGSMQLFTDKLYLDVETGGVFREVQPMDHRVSGVERVLVRNEDYIARTQRDYY